MVSGRYPGGPCFVCFEDWFPLFPPLFPRSARPLFTQDPFENPRLWPVPDDTAGSVTRPALWEGDQH